MLLNKNKLRNSVTLLISITLVAILAVACNLNGSNSGLGRLKVVMADSPAQYDSVIINVKEVQVQNTTDTLGWITITKQPHTFDLLKLVNGAYKVLGDSILPAGTYPQIRLILGTGNHVVINGQSYNLTVPSGYQTGVKLNVNATINADYTYTLLLDFDASRSIVKTGNSKGTTPYLLKPVINATNVAITGAISGVVFPAIARPVVYGISGGDTLASTYADTTSGKFTLIGLKQGTYTVAVDPTNTSYNDTTKSGVDVAAGKTTQIDTLKVSQK